jgi:hypothetical protein
MRLGISAVLFLASMGGASYAASPFDGHWEGEAPYAQGCGVWKFYLDIKDGAVSGIVTGQLNGAPASGVVTEGNVSPDGAATIAWGKNYHFQGNFRFSTDSMAGNITSACGNRSMTGKRIVGQQPQNASASFDGDYVGTITLLPSSQNNNCGGAGPFQRTVRISNNRWVFSFNPTRNESISGTVNLDGSTSGFGASNSGGNALKGRIQGTEFTGEVGSGYCAYSLQLKKL